MRRGVFSGLAVAGCFLSACSAPSSVEQTETEIIEEGELPNSSEVSESIFTSDGRRITLVPSVVGLQDEAIAITEYCIGGSGGDLITISEQRVYRGAGGGIDRAVGHAACADGILTPEDFLTSK
jgi:hypothetical protein